MENIDTLIFIGGNFSMRILIAYALLHIEEKLAYLLEIHHGIYFCVHWMLFICFPVARIRTKNEMNALIYMDIKCLKCKYYNMIVIKH